MFRPAPRTHTFTCAHTYTNKNTHTWALTPVLSRLCVCARAMSPSPLCLHLLFLPHVFLPSLKSQIVLSTNPEKLLPTDPYQNKMMVSVVLFHRDQKHSHDVVCNVSGVAQTRVTGASLSTLPPSDHSLSLMRCHCFLCICFTFGPNSRKHWVQNIQSACHLVASVYDVQSVRQNHYFTLQSIFGVLLLLLHLGVCVHIMINWRAAWSIRCIFSSGDRGMGKIKVILIDCYHHSHLFPLEFPLYPACVRARARLLCLSDCLCFCMCASVCICYQVDVDLCVSMYASACVCV